MRLWLVLVFASFLSPAHAQQKYPSLLWKITGNGLSKPSYLYGTMHVSNRVAWHLSEEFFEALKSVDVVGLETSPAAWLDNMQKTGELAEISRPQLGLNYESDFYAQAFKTTFPEQKTLQSIISYDPDIINGLLYRQNSNREDFEEDTYVDLFIYQTAEKLNKPVISLENFEAAEIQARLAAVPDEETQKRYIDFREGAGHQSVEDAYRLGNLDLLDSLSKQTTSGNTQKHLIEIRNAYFTRSIDSVLKKQTLFSGVGAAHLPGNTGVIELLRKLGYTVEPINGKVSKRSALQREKLGALEKVLKFENQIGPDSLYSINLPGKLYPIYESPALSYHIQPDMINGHFFTAVRLRHYGAFYGVTPQQMLAKIDSLLFENIAGKILEKKTISNSKSWQGIEVLSVTSRGDQQRYQFFCNENDLYLFKLGAKGGYASSKEGTRYFTSIVFSSNNTSVKTFQPLSAGFKVNVTEKPSYYATNTGGIGLVEELLSTGTDQSMLVQHAIYNDFNYLEEDTFELVQFTKRVLETYHYQLRGSYALLKMQDLPALRFQASSGAGRKLDGKIIIKGVHYYLVLQASKAGAETDYTAFDGFELTDFKYNYRTKKIKDEEFLFTVIDEVSEDGQSKFNENLSTAYRLAFPDTAKKTHKDEPFRSSSKQYFSPSSNEYVNITFEKYDYFDFKKQDQLIAKIDSVFAKKTSMKRTNVLINKDAKNLTYQFTLRDTASSRAIAYKLFFRNSTMHELSAPFDTIIGLGRYPKSFFDSFMPLDSAAGPSIFEPKFKALVQALTSSDSIISDRAEQSLAEIGFAPEYASDFVQLIQDKSFSKFDQKTRAQLLVSGGTLKSDAIITPYKKLYEQYSDSFYLQLCVLKGLAYHKSTVSYQSFVELLTQNPPLVGDDASVQDVFSILYDSIPLCRNFFPSLLKLTRYDEYRSSVYALLAELSTRSLISTTQLTAQRSDILADANLFYKRWSQNPETNLSAYQSEDVDEILRYNGYQSLPPNLTSSVKSSRPQLLNYVIILAPFYEQDEKVKKFIDKIIVHKDVSIAMPALVYMMKTKPHINDSLLRLNASSVFSKAIFYHQLKEAKLLHLFPSQKLNQEGLVFSLLKAQESQRPGLKDKKLLDSLVLYKVVPVQNRYEKGDLYIYRKSGNKKNSQAWQLAFVNEKDGKLSDNIRLAHSKYFPNPNKTEQEQVLEITEVFSNLYRNRTGNQSPF